MTLEQKIAKANELLDKYGYLVMAWHPGPKPMPEVGQVISSPISGIPGPFVVIGISSRAEAQKQTKEAGRWWSGRGATAWFKVAAE